MSDKMKKICDWKKDRLKERFDEFRGYVIEPTHICAKCGRVANEKKMLCKPFPLR